MAKTFLSALVIAAALASVCYGFIWPTKNSIGNIEVPPPPVRRCSYKADYMRVFSPQQFSGVWFVDSTSFDNNIRVYEQCEKQTVQQIGCNAQTGCNNTWQQSINLNYGKSYERLCRSKNRRSPAQTGILRYFGYVNQTYGPNTGVFFGAYYDAYYAKQWFTVDSWIVKTDYTSYALAYTCQRDNLNAVADTATILSRSPQGVGPAKRNQLLQELRNNFKWTNLTQMYTRSNVNCTNV